MSNYPLRDGDARGSEEEEISSVVEALQGLKGFAGRLISPALSPALDGMDLLQECFLRARSKLDVLGPLSPCDRLEWLRRHLLQMARNQRRLRKREAERRETKGRTCEICYLPSGDGDRRVRWLGPLLRGLGRVDALLVVLVLIKGVPLREAARKIGLSRSDASRRVHELRDWFRHSLRSDVVRCGDSAPGPNQENFQNSGTNGI